MLCKAAEGCNGMLQLLCQPCSLQGPADLVGVQLQSVVCRHSIDDLQSELPMFAMLITMPPKVVPTCHVHPAAGGTAGAYKAESFCYALLRRMNLQIGKLLPSMLLM